MSQEPLREESGRPAAEEFQKVKLSFSNAPAAGLRAFLIMSVGEPGEHGNTHHICSDVSQIWSKTKNRHRGEEEKKTHRYAQGQREFATGNFFFVHSVHRAGAAFPIITDAEPNEITRARQAVAFDEITNVKKQAALIGLQKAVALLAIPFYDSSRSFRYSHSITVSAPVDGLLTKHRSQDDT